MADLGIKIIIDGINNASNAIKSASDDLQSLEKQAAPLNSSLNALSDTMGQIAIAAGAMSVALGGAFALATKTASDFQYSMANVESILQISAKSTEALAGDIGMLSAQAKQLGLETQFSAVQAADAMTELVRAGYDANKTFSSMPAVLDLAAASGMGLARTSEALVNILNPFKLSADQASVAANTLAVIAASSSLTFSDLAESMKYAAPAAQAAGLSLNETAAIMGALGDAGIKASMGGTAVRGMMTDLAAPTKKATDTLREMNVEIVKGTEGNFNFLATMEKLGEANMTLAQATKIFGVLQATTGLVVAQSSEKIKRLTELTYTQTDALTKMREVLEKSLNRALVILTSSIEGLGIALGTPLLEPLTAFINQVSNVINVISQWLTAHKTLTAVLMSTVGVGALVTAGIALLAGAFTLVIKGVQLFISASQQLTVVLSTGLLNSIKLVTTHTLEEAAAHKANAVALEAEAVAARTAAAAKSGAAATSTASAAAGGVLSTLGNKAGAAALGGIAFSTISSSIAAATEQTNKWADALGVVSSVLVFIPTPLTKIVGVIGLVASGFINLVSASGLFKSKIDEASLSADGVKTSVNGLDAATQSMVQSAVDAGMSWKEFKEQYVATFKQQPPDEVSSAFYRLRAAGVEAGEKTAAALKLVGTETGNVGNGVGTAKKSLEELDKEAGKMAASLNWAFQELHRVSALAFDALTKSIDTATTEWKRSLKNSEKDPEAFSAAFETMSGAIQKSLTTLNTVANERLAQLQERLSKAIQAGNGQKEIEAMQNGIEKFGEQAAKVYEKMAKDASNALKELQDKYDEVVKKMETATKEFAKQELADIDTIAKARRSVAELTMTDEQKYHQRKVDIWNREEEIQNLIAQGGEENLKRARELVNQNISDQTQLKEVKRKYIDMYPEEAARINEQIYALEGVKNKTAEQKAELVALKNLRQDTVSVIEAAGAAEDRNKVISQAENDLQVIRNKQEDEKTSELNRQKTAIEEQIAEMKKQQAQAELLLTQFRQAIAITLDTSGATRQMEALFQNRVIKATIEISGEAVQGHQSGGMISQAFALGGRVRGAIRAALGQFVPGGYGGGDKVPALLEPGEFVWRKEAVASVGPRFFDTINRAGSSALSVLAGMPARFADGGDVSFDTSSTATRWIYNIDNLIGDLSSQSSQNKVSFDFGTFGDSVSRLETVMASMASGVTAQDRIIESVASRLERSFGRMKTTIDVLVKDGTGSASVDMLA